MYCYTHIAFILQSVCCLAGYVHSSHPLLDIINNGNNSVNTKSNSIIPEMSTILSFNVACITSTAVYPFQTDCYVCRYIGMSGLLKYLVCGLIQNNAVANWFVLLHVQVT